jgi:signal transduction histidine kinase
LPSIASLRNLDIGRILAKWMADDVGAWIPWSRPGILPIYTAALAVAHHAAIIAKLTGRCHVDAAWTAGLLAPLGWFAVAAIDPDAVVACRADPVFDDDALTVQQRYWGLDHRTIASRLCQLWQLPAWLVATVARLDESLAAVEAPNVDSAVFACVKLGAVMAARAGFDLHLAAVSDDDALLNRLGLEAADLPTIEFRFRAADLTEGLETSGEDPRDRPELLKRLQARSTPQQDPQRAYAALERQQQSEEERLRRSKLEALVEFAAGASHEINNPLAVISGQSQYLLGRTSDERHRQALDSIIRQTQRIHSILTDLMQFARPARPFLQRLNLDSIIAAALDSCRGLAGEFGVKLERVAAANAVWVDADAQQLRTAVSCLVRNAVEAASADKGWVCVRCETGGNSVAIIVEDSGPGPTAEQREHMFDPFYSGRAAGRGRGLGLPTAWRLAREQGGDVRYVPTLNSPTCFVMSLPLAEPAEQRLSA